jgi:hypothetical protein
MVTEMKISRRKFLHIAGTGMILAGGLPPLSGCSGLIRVDTEKTEIAMTGLSRHEIEILYMASLSPSGHNTQPWGIRIIAPYTWIITSDEQRWLPAVDPEQRETLLSIGAFIENVAVAAKYYGYELSLTILAKTSKDRDIGQVTLKKTNNPDPDPLLMNRIKRRRVVRKGYMAMEVGEKDVAYITNKDFARMHYFPPHSRQGRYLREGTIEATRQQTYRSSAQEELANWIRWSDDDALRFRDGLTPEGMEINGFAGWYVRNFYNREDVLTKAFREATVRNVVQQVSTHGGWLIITSDASAVGDLLETGRLFERMFLRSREKMIAVHPMTQILEEPQWQNMIATALGLSGRVQFILRIGYLETYPDPITLRRPVNWFVRRA